jgi:hypothetical protein
MVFGTYVGGAQDDRLVGVGVDATRDIQAR